MQDHPIGVSPLKLRGTSQCPLNETDAFKEEDPQRLGLTCPLSFRGKDAQVICHGFCKRRILRSKKIKELFIRKLK